MTSDNEQINGRNEEIKNNCHIKLNTGNRHRTPRLIIVCDCNKLELFTGPYEEYYQTFDGELLDEFDGTKSYIFEINFEKKQSHVMLKVIFY